MNSGRCTLAEAFELLAPDFEPKAAATAIEYAAHTDEHFPLYCDGKVVNDDIAKSTVVVPPSKNGPADILCHGPWISWPPGAKWELDTDAVLALKPQPDTRVESAQATAIAALEKAEAATAEIANARAEMERARAEERTEAEKAWAEAQAEAEKAWAEAQVKAEKVWVEAQTARERAKTAEERAEAVEARLEAIEARIKAKTDDNPRRRKPGTKASHPLWRLEAAAFALQYFKKNTRMPSAGEVAEHLQIKCDGWAPDESDIRDALKPMRPE